MRKMKLELEAIQVESFVAVEGPDQRGTVLAHSAWDTCEAPCPSRDGPGWSCDATCDRTCGQPGTCGYNWCGTYEEHGCPNTEWICTTPDYAC